MRGACVTGMLLAALMAPVSALAGHQESRQVLIGNPPVERFTPNIDVYPQHFCVEQDSLGRALLCSYDGVLEYDGERWRLTRMPNGEVARALAIADDGTIYVGGYNLFGILRRDATGILQFEDLTPWFRASVGPVDFAEIWDILITPEGIYFRALTELFRWNPATKEAKHWSHAGRFGRMIQHGGKTTIHFRTEGLKQWDGKDWILMPESRHFGGLMQVLLPLNDGSALCVDENGGWWRVLANGSVKAQKKPVGMPADATLNAGLVLANGDVAIGSSAGEVFFINAQLSHLHRVVLDPGYVMGFHRNRGGGVLAVLQGSLYHVGWPAPWTVIGSEHNVSGNYYSLTEWNGHQYLLTSSGIYRGESGESGARFTRVPGSTDAPYHLLPLDRQRALVAESKRLTLVEGGVVKPFSNDLIYPREFYRSAQHPALAYLATDFGLRVIDLRNGIKVSGAVPETAPPGISSLLELSPSEIWVGTDRRGMMRMSVDNAGRITGHTVFGPAEGLELGQVADAYVSSLGGGQWVVSTRKGFFTWDGKQFRPTGVGNLGGMRQAEETFLFVATAGGDVWAYSNTRLFHREKNGEWKQAEVRPLLRGAIVQHKVLDKDQIAFVTSYGMLIKHSIPENTVTDRAKVQLTGVTMIHADGHRTPMPLASEKPIEIPEGPFSLRFDYAIPEIVRPNIKRYQATLTGEDESPGEWAISPQSTYYNLRPRMMELVVRGLDSEGMVSETPVYRIQVLPPWYARPWSKALFSILVIALLAVAMLAFIRYRLHRLKAANLELERKVDERTVELADAIRRLDMMAHMDGLTGIANRRSMDEYLPAVWAQCREQQRPLSVMVIDADHFKRYNDERGHVAGDDLLKNLTRHLLGQLRRAEDFLARYGGEEFVVILPGADHKVAGAMAEAMRNNIAESALGITVSIGVCTQVPDDSAPEVLIARADQALYDAKRAGRNRVQACAEC